MDSDKQAAPRTSRDPLYRSTDQNSTILKEQILNLLGERDGLTDRQIAETLRGAHAPKQPIHQACHQLERTGNLARVKRADGLIGNYLRDSELATRAPLPAPVPKGEEDPFCEDSLKQLLKVWLQDQGWIVKVAWGKERGIDVEATRGSERWVIEVKGRGSQAMRVNYFVAMLGETLQRMDDPEAKYSISLPALDQLQGLWSRLPKLAKLRTQISALFVHTDGSVVEET